MSRSLPLLFALVSVSVSACGPEEPSPTRTCWPLAGATQANRCNEQACFDKVEKITVKSPLGAQFRCSPSTQTCTPAPPEELIENGGPYPPIVRYEASFAEGLLMLTFDDRILREGYSLENFRKYQGGGEFAWYDAPYNPEWILGTFEVVSYQNQRLRIRIEGEVVAKRENTLVDPYPCGGKTGIGATCTQGTCDYAPVAGSETAIPVHVVADVELPIQQATPSP